MVDAERTRTRWARQELGRGVLDSEQHLVWVAPWPTGESRLRSLADTLEREQLLSIERFSLRLLRCRREGSRLTCRLPGGILAIAFADDSTEITPQRVRRRWVVEPGFMSRRVSTTAGSTASYGRLELGAELDEQDDRTDSRIHGWAAVTAFPSRFLAPLPAPLRAISALWRAIGRLYALYHALATFSCLRHVARAMHSVAE